MENFTLAKKDPASCQILTTSGVSLAGAMGHRICGIAGKYVGLWAVAPL